MRGVILVVLLYLVLALSACGGSTASDAKAVETQVAARIFATQTASAPTPPATPQLIAKPESDTSIPPRGTYAHQFTITEVFDRFRNWTEVLLVPSVTDALSGRPGNLMVSYVYPGTEPRLPSLVSFTLVQISPEWRYLKCHFLDLLLDGNTAIHPETTHNGEVAGTGEVSEFINSSLDVATFLQVVNAQTVEVKLCNTEFRLTEAQMAALRDVASRMQPRNFTPIK